MHLSKESRYFRFMTSLRELSPKKLKYFTEIDLRPAHGLCPQPSCVKIKSSKSAVARYIHTEIPGSCEFGVTVDDAWHGRSVAGLLMNSLEDTARQMRIQDDGGHRAPEQQQDAQICSETWFQNPLRFREKADTVHIALQL